MADRLLSVRVSTDPVVDQVPTSVIEWSQETGVTWIGAVLVVLLLLHLLASWAEKKGWIYYRRGGGKGRGVALSNALAEFEALLNPAAEHRIVEEQSQEILRSEIGQSIDGEEDDDDARTD
jgi:hypothetical protein